MSKREVDSKTMIDASLRAGRGQAIWLEAAPWRVELAEVTDPTVKGKPLELDPDINSTILEQNALAAKVMREFKIPINELYQLMSPHLDFAAGDRFHWKREASNSMGAAISTAIQARLPH